ncbi:hypothetical protein [Streptomyces sp. NPDC055189]
MSGAQITVVATIVAMLVGVGSLWYLRERHLREERQERKAETEEARRILGDVETAFQRPDPPAPQELADFAERLGRTETSAAKEVRTAVERVGAKVDSYHFRRCREEAVLKDVIAARERIDTYVEKGR